MEKINKPIKWRLILFQIFFVIFVIWNCNPKNFKEAFIYSLFWIPVGALVYWVVERRHAGRKKVIMVDGEENNIVNQSDKETGSVMDIFLIAFGVIMALLILCLIYQAWDTFTNNNCIGMKYSSSLKPTPVNIHSCQDKIEQWGSIVIFLILPIIFIGGVIWYYFEKNRYNRDTKGLL